MRRKKIGQLLIENDYVSPEHLKEALEAQKARPDRICNILIELGYLDEDDLFELLSAMPGMASVDLSKHEVNSRLLELLRYEVARRLEVVPIGKIGNVLTVAMVCPLDRAGRKELERATGLQIRPLLSTRRDVFAVLKKYYGDLETKKYLSTVETSPEAQSEAVLIAGIESLPTLPNVLNMISSAGKDPDLCAADLADIATTDGAVSARLLKLANLPAFGYARTISDVGRAIEMLGPEKAAAMALSVPVFHPSRDEVAFDFKAYWNHSLACAELARWIAITQESCEPGEAFIAGLLHDMGKVVVTMRARPKQSEADLPEEIRSTMKNCLTMKAKEKALGTTHSEVGYLLSENWLLPPSIGSAIRYHHMPELDPDFRILSSIAYLANVFCKLHRSELMREGGFDHDVRQALEPLGFSERTLYKILKVYAEKGSVVLVP